MSKRKKVKLDDHEYENALNKLVDTLFETASKQGWTWQKLSEESGVGGPTIDRLGNRETKLPQLRTVEKIAQALGGRVDFQSKPFVKSRAGSKLKIWKLPREPRRQKLKVA